MKMNFISRAIILVLSISSVNYLHAQIIKGTWSLGPTVQYSSSKTEFDALDLSIKSTDLQLGVSVGYYFIDNLEVAIGIGMVSSSSTIVDFETNSSGFNIGPVVHYKVPLSGNLYLPIGGGLRYNSVTSEDDNSDETTYTGMSYLLFTGLEYIVNNKLGALLFIGPESGTFSDPDSDNEFDINNFGVGLGFNFYF
jgi:outer membrane protein with beta-barrel domain